MSAIKNPYDTDGIVRVLLYSFLELLLIVILSKIVHSNIVSILGLIVILYLLLAL